MVNRIHVVAGLLGACLLAGCAAHSGRVAGPRGSGGFEPVEMLPDLSGLAWIEGDWFVGVHDAKVPGRPRVSIVQLPGGEGPDAGQVLWRPQELDWPEPGAPRDLESAARIPGTALVLLCESGQERDGDFHYNRIFKVEHSAGRLMLRQAVQWPAEIENVEGTAVGRVGEQLVFLYAERAQGRPSTQLRWTTMQLQPLRFGPFQEVVLENPAPVGPDSRPVSALEVDDAGVIYIASAFDPGSDDGPFRSAVWRVGRLHAADDGSPAITLDGQATLLGTADGFKIESVAIRQRAGGEVELFIGTDDEHFGGVLRHLPLNVE